MDALRDTFASFGEVDAIESEASQSFAACSTATTAPKTSTSVIFLSKPRTAAAQLAFDHQQRQMLLTSTNRKRLEQAVSAFYSMVINELCVLQRAKPGLALTQTPITSDSGYLEYNIHQTGKQVASVKIYPFHHEHGGEIVTRDPAGSSQTYRYGICSAPRLDLETMRPAGARTSASQAVAAAFARLRATL